MERRILQMLNPEMPVAPTCPCWQTPRSHRQFKVRVSGYFWVVWSKDRPMLFCASPQLLSSGLALANRWQHCSCCCRHAHGLVQGPAACLPMLFRPCSCRTLARLFMLLKVSSPRIRCKRSDPFLCISSASLDIRAVVRR